MGLSISEAGWGSEAASGAPASFLFGRLHPPGSGGQENPKMPGLVGPQESPESMEKMPQYSVGLCLSYETQTEHVSWGATARTGRCGTQT